MILYHKRKKNILERILDLFNIHYMTLESRYEYVEFNLSKGVRKCQMNKHNAIKH